MSESAQRSEVTPPGGHHQRPALTWLRVVLVLVAAAGALVILRTDDRPIELEWGGDGGRPVAILRTPPPNEQLTLSFQLAVSADTRLLDTSPLPGLELSNAWVSEVERLDLSHAGDGANSLRASPDGLALADGLQWLVLRWDVTDCAAFVSGDAVKSEPLELVIVTDGTESTHVVDGAFIPGFSIYNPTDCVG
ncbi:MAG: hypothetical protein P8N02_18765 [Actinomycetota bacterium]|jgi:hypothetical protein|nr:hypothetical protein [Actinomycetota bacterium]